MIALALAALVAAQDTTRLTLADAVERALAQHPTVGIARAARSRAAADAREADSHLLPRLALDVSATQWQEPMLVYPLHGFTPGMTAPSFDRTLFQGSVFLNWTLFDFGARRGRARAAGALRTAAEAALTASEQQLVTRTTAAYLRVLTLRGLLAAQDQRLAALDAEAARARRLLAEGKGARVAVLRVEATAARARAERAGVAGHLDVAEHELAQLIAVPYDTITRAALQRVALRPDAAADTARAVLIALASDGSPDVVEARRRRDAAQAAAAAARATRLPELRLQTGLVDRGAAGEPFQTEWQAGIGLSYPLYTGGQRAGTIARAEAEAQFAADHTRLAELTATQNVDRALAALREARARVAALEAAVTASEAVVATERTALEIGAGTQTDYLDALAESLRERSGLIEARHTEIVAVVELARVTGRLAPAWLSATITPAGDR
jgi:outer membrane protein